MTDLVHRAGRYITQPTGYKAFMPERLPPDPSIQYDTKLQTLLSEADRALARLDAATEFLPNSDLFVRMYVRKEAVLSSQIEGTQASMVDLLEHEIQATQAGSSDVSEVSNYVAAMNLGLERLRTLPLSLRLIREIHERLMRGARGAERSPGEFRRSQNWIGPSGSTLANANFVPPPPADALEAMGDLERFMHDPTPMPLLVKIGLVHVQFETIHPFLDGNGRVGRLLVTFLLCVHGALRKPSLYLSHYFKQRRQEYYDHLQAVRETGDFERWLHFFLEGIRDVSTEATETARDIIALREKHRQLVTSQQGKSTAGVQLLERLFEQPITTVSHVERIINRTYPVANELVGHFVRLGLLTEMTGQMRNRVFAYQPYLEIFGDLKP